MCAVENLH